MLALFYGVACIGLAFLADVLGTGVLQVLNPTNKPKPSILLTPGKPDYLWGSRGAPPGSLHTGRPLQVRLGWRGRRNWFSAAGGSTREELLLDF